jgi:chemotaxis protein MotB
MQDNGVNANQVLQIRGYADQRLRKPDSPGDPSNRRISVIVQYLVKDVEESKESKNRSRPKPLAKTNTQRLQPKPNTRISPPADYW